MLLSIILPSFQQGAYLKEALLSISQQRFTDYEVLVLDAGSTDNTAAVVAAFSHLPIAFAQEPDKGVYDAMNKGVQQARGKWLYFMGCDDRLYNASVLQNVFGGGLGDHYDVLYGDVLMGESKMPYDGEFTPYMLMDRNICHQAMFVQKRVFEKVGLFDIQYRALADWEFNMRWFNNRNITKHYVPVLVAHYSTLGFSATYLDAAFYEAKSALIKKHFPLSTRLINRMRTSAIYRSLFN